MATIIALSTYKHADHFNKRVVAKAKREDTEEKEEHKHETATVVKEIQAKQAASVEEIATPVVADTEKKAPAKAIKKASPKTAK